MTAADRLRQITRDGSVGPADSVAACEAGAHALELLARAEGADPLPIIHGWRHHHGQPPYVAFVSGEAEAPTEAEARRALAGRLIATALALLEKP